MNRWLAFIPLAALAVLVVAAALLLTRETERETFSEGRIGRPAPTYALAPLGDGPMVTSDAFAGRAYVVNVFASWCTPCRAEHPQLMALQASGVEILGVAYKDRPAATAGFLNDLGDPFARVGQDPEGRLALELGIVGVPETFVIGPDGSIRAVHRGPLTAQVIEQTIRPALAQR
ncbi:MAG: DsbE family thiol:disulfide interchange protein [Hyphomonadaceae bacterium]|nr:DsbE family thiol:disulfide interchange protein [Hyphomonadaceae bacterium]